MSFHSARRRYGGGGGTPPPSPTAGPAPQRPAPPPREGGSGEAPPPRAPAPLDTATILQSVEKTGRLVVADQSTRHGSAAAGIAAEGASEGFSSLEAPMKLRSGE